MNQNDASTSASVRKRNMFLFLMLALMLALYVWTRSKVPSKVSIPVACCNKSSWWATTCEESISMLFQPNWLHTIWLHTNWLQVSEELSYPCYCSMEVYCKSYKPAAPPTHLNHHIIGKSLAIISIANESIEIQTPNTKQQQQQQVHYT